MKYFLISILPLFSLSLSAQDFYGHSVKSIKGEKIDLSQFKGKTVLVTNIASQCGFTPQLDDLEALYKKYSKKGFVIIGVPSNDFGGQTPESDQEMAKFCKLRYGVTFPLLRKSIVKGPNKSPLFSFLTSRKGKAGDINWNFEKFLIDKQGQLVKRFSSNVSPLNSELEKTLKSIL